MRREIVTASSAAQARKLAPWAAVVIKVDGGYLCFESVDDVRIWRAQK